MKKITIITSLTLSIIFLSSNSGAQQNILKPTNLKKDSINIVQSEPKINITNYKKASDSLLDIADQNNISAYQKLEEIKRLENIKEVQKKEINNVRKKIKNNLRLTLELYKNKLKEKKNSNNELTINNQIYKIDSMYQKGSLFKKSKWVYEITFPDGSKRKID